MFILAALLALSAGGEPLAGPSASVPPVAESAAPPAAAAPEVHGLLQLQYLSVVRNIQPSPAETGFMLRRARASVEGAVFSPRFRYRAELEMGQGNLAPLDLFAEFKPTASWSIRVGQLRVPFSRNWMISEQNLSFAERSLATEEFRYDYDVGVLASKTFLDGRLEAMFGIFNGAGKNVVGNDNVDPLFVARFNGTIGALTPREEGDLGRTRPPSLTLGAAATLDYVPVPDAYGFASGQPLDPVPIVVRDTNGNGRPDGVGVLQLEGDVAFRWRGLALDGEAYFRRESWADVGALQPPASQFTPNSRFGGAFAQATYYVLPARLEAGGRVAVAEISPLTVDGRKRPPTSCVDLGNKPFPCALPFTDRRSEVTLVVVGHWFGHGIQVVGMYSALRYHTDQQARLPWSREQRFLAQTQLAF
jgi:hypothetical protein